MAPRNAEAVPSFSAGHFYKSLSTWPGLSLLLRSHSYLTMGLLLFQRSHGKTQGNSNHPPTRTRNAPSHLKKLGVTKYPDVCPTPQRGRGAQGVPPSPPNSPFGRMQERPSRARIVPAPQNGREETPFPQTPKSKEDPGQEWGACHFQKLSSSQSKWRSRGGGRGG